MTSDLTLDTDATPGGFTFHSLVINAGATLKATGSNPLIINVDHQVSIQGTIDLSGGKGSNSAGNHKAAGGGAGGGALKISAPTITIGPAGAIHADGGDGGDGGGPGQSFFGAGTPWSTGAGNGAGGVGVAGGGAGGAGGGSSLQGRAGSGPGASTGGLTHGGVPPGAGGAGHAFAGTPGFGQYSGLRPAGGAAYGDSQLSGGLQGGSGAGGGGNDGDNEEGAGGGGSGGMIYLVAARLHIEGTIAAKGGLGGRDDYHFNGGANRECCNNGGPGSVGRVRLDSDAVTGSGTITPAANYAGGDWKWPAEHNVDCKDYHPRIGGGQEYVGGWGRGGYKLAHACDASDGTPFHTYNGYGVNGADYIDFIFTFEDANTWCSGYRQFGHIAYTGGATSFAKDIEIYTGDANFGPWTKVATDRHSSWHNDGTSTFPDDGTTTEWAPTGPSKYLKVRTLTNQGYTGYGGIITVRFLQLKFSSPPPPPPSPPPPPPSPPLLDLYQPIGDATGNARWLTRLLGPLAVSP